MLAQIIRALWRAFPRKVGGTGDNTISCRHELNASNVGAIAWSQTDCEIDPVSNQIEIGVRQNELEFQSRERFAKGTEERHDASVAESSGTASSAMAAWGRHLSQHVADTMTAGGGID